MIERDDGFISASAMGPKLYLAPFRRWPSHHRRAMRYARGRVLDVGAGAGRVSLHLQGRGQVVIAIDNSPGAIEVCRRRGVRDARLLAFDAVDDSLGRFDTIVLFGNNFGLFGTPTKARRLLRQLHRMTSNDARMVVESRDVEQRGAADASWHRRYRERNVARGRLPGQSEYACGFVTSSVPGWTTRWCRRTSCVRSSTGRGGASRTSSTPTTPTLRLSRRQVVERGRRVALQVL